MKVERVNPRSGSLPRLSLVDQILRKFEHANLVFRDGKSEMIGVT